MNFGFTARDRTIRASAADNGRALGCEGIGGVENDEIGRAPERGRSRSEPTDERDIFRSFQQIAYRIFGGMDEHIRGCDPGFKCARRGRRYAIRAAIGMGDGGEIRACDLRAIEVAPEKIFDACAIGARSGTKNAHHGRRFHRRRGGASGGEWIFLGALLARRDRAHRGIEQRDLGGEQIPEKAGNPPRHVNPGPTGNRRRQEPRFR